MEYKKIKNLKPEKFKRLIGVKPTTFKKMVEVVKEAELQRREKARNKGKQASLSIEDQVLLMLDYYREYRTYFHVGMSYGVSESQANRITNKVESILIKSGEFRLPGKKTLHDSNLSFEVIVIDASETPIERPKKNRKSTTAERRKNTH